MGELERTLLSVTRGTAFLVSVVVLVPLVLFDYLRTVLSTTGLPGA